MWKTNGQATPGSHTLYVVETCDPEDKLEARVSDKLQFTVSITTFGGVAAAAIDGCFWSDLENSLGKLPANVNPADVFLENGTPVRFSALNLTGSFVSDSACRKE